MTHLTQQTSLQAFYDKIKPELGARQEYVLSGLKQLKSATNLELSVHLDLPINATTPRIFELRKLGLVREQEKRNCKISSRKAIAWEIARDTLF